MNLKIKSYQKNVILPKISIIIAVYNVKDYISKCIESVLNQTYENLEIIIVNDGSTDTSGEICECYSKKDDRIILMQQENQGSAVARNNALDVASGEYIGFVDSDDWIEPDMFYTLYNIVIEHGADISICNFYYANMAQNGEIALYAGECEKNITIMENEDKMTYYFNYIIYSIVPWNKLYNKTLFNEIRFTCNKIVDDAFTTYKLIDKANRMIAIPDCKYYYLQRSTAVTKKRFSLNDLQRIEASIERYNYIATKYPNFESICRKYIFIDLLYCVNKAVTDDAIDIYIEEIRTVIKQVHEYSSDNCGLSKREERELALLFDNFKKYVLTIKMYNKYTRIKG